MPPQDPTPQLEPYILRQDIARRVSELGREIDRDYPSGELVLLGVLKGSYIFLADLCRAVQRSMRVEFLGVRSYGDGTESSGAVQITQDLTRPVQGAHVLIVEDIVDTGLTAHYLIDQVRSRGPASVRLCALLHKPARTVREVPIDYLGFTIEDCYVVGYGLDRAQQLRNLPDLCRFDEG